VKLIESFDAFLVDLDGVVWRGDEPIDGAREAIGELRDRGKRVVFVTNNASRTPRDYAAKLMRMRIPTAPADIITSAHAVVQHLGDIGLSRGERVHVCAARGMSEVLRAYGYVPTKDVDDVAALVVAWNPKLVMDDIRLAADVARGGVPFVGANRDATYPVEAGLLPGTGAILAAIEVASGRRATVVGKPAPYLVRAALQRAGCDADRALFVGDRADSDVAAAQAAGVCVVLVLTGVTTRAELGSLTHRPDWILDRLSELVDADLQAIVVDQPARRVGAAAAERDDQDEPGEEAADMREVGDTTLIAGASESGARTEELDDEPQAERHPGRSADAEEEEPQRDERDDRRRGP
jgi:4-nitrophenyl phosphatase